LTRSKDKRWDTKFAKFVLAFGPSRLAAELGVTNPSIYKWIRGVTSPDIVHLVKIERLARRSRLKLSVSEIRSQRKEAYSKRGISNSARLARV